MSKRKGQIVCEMTFTDDPNKIIIEGKSFDTVFRKACLKALDRADTFTQFSITDIKSKRVLETIMKRDIERYLSVLQSVALAEIEERNKENVESDLLLGEVVEPGEDIRIFNGLEFGGPMFEGEEGAELKRKIEGRAL